MASVVISNPPVIYPIAPSNVLGPGRIITSASGTIVATDHNTPVGLALTSAAVASIAVTPGLPIGFIALISDVNGTVSGTDTCTLTFSGGETCMGQSTFVLDTAFATGRLCKMTSTNWSAF